MSEDERRIINKTMDRADLHTDEAQAVIADLNALIMNMRARNLAISSWYGKFNLPGNPGSLERINRGYNYEPLEGAADDRNFPWFKYWEIAWVAISIDFRPGQKVLDMGGSSSLFSYYLASKGLDVTTVDLSRDLVDNANNVAKKTGWKLRNLVMDMRELNLESQFDHITSICVYEHIPLRYRIEINKRIKQLLVDGGRFSITFDYRNPSRHARIGSPEDVVEQFVKPSGMSIRGNLEFAVSSKNYMLHPFFYRDRLWRLKLECLLRRDFLPWECFRTKD
jgi:2-polyprenyl-3-methyl-5-hydroxy-6-metoxy-1,4-benzoquinol methylase